MRSHPPIAPLAFGALALAAFSCATSPTGRRQLHLFPEQQLDDLGAQSFAMMEREVPLSQDPAENQAVRCVVGKLRTAVHEMYPETKDLTWEVRLFEREDPNAFALPGGKIGVHSGLLEVTETQDQLAAVIGHEMAHVVAEHANERVSSQFAAEGGLALAGVLLGDMGDPKRQLLLSALGLGAQVGFILPYSRSHESEADEIGLALMARAGFDPKEAVALWRRMEAVGGGQPPEFLSTHPSHGSRIERLTTKIPDVMPAYERALALGRLPACEEPPPRAASVFGG